MKQPLTSSPYRTIYHRFVDAIMDKARERPKWTAEETIKNVAVNDRLFDTYYRTFKKSEIDALVKLVKLRKTRVR